MWGVLEDFKFILAESLRFPQGERPVLLAHTTPSQAHPSSCFGPAKGRRPKREAACEHESILCMTQGGELTTGTCHPAAWARWSGSPALLHTMEQGLMGVVQGQLVLPTHYLPRTVLFLGVSVPLPPLLDPHFSICKQFVLLGGCCITGPNLFLLEGRLLSPKEGQGFA